MSPVRLAARARGGTVSRVPVVAAPGLTYPDPRALLKIDPTGVSRTVQGTGTRVVVAIVDSGVDVDHPDLRGYVSPGACRMGTRRDDDVTDQDGHGTNLAGTILTTANRVKGLTLLPVKFFDVVTQPLAANAAAAIHFAVSKHAAIINLSIDLGLGSFELEDAIRTACRSGALIVIAAGNTGSDNDRYPSVPARYAAECGDGVIVVMATDAADRKPSFSNFGTRSVDLAAPGADIVSTRRLMSGDDDRRYTRYTGTSAAAAHVTGAAALLKSQNPARTAAQLKACLMGAVDPIPSLTGVDGLPNLKCVRGGRLNLGHALTKR